LGQEILPIISGWWFGTLFLTFHSVGNVNVFQPPTSINWQRSPQKKSASGGGFTPTGACRMAVAASGQTPGTQGISSVICWKNARSIAGKIFLVDFLLPFFFWKTGYLHIFLFLWRTTCEKKGKQWGYTAK
jgi:hypothetical protein